MSIYEQIFEAGVTVGRGICPEMVAAASKAGEKALAEVLHHSGAECLVENANFGPVKNAITQLDGFGMRAKNALSVSSDLASPMEPTLRTAGTDFHFIGKPDVEFRQLFSKFDARELNVAELPTALREVLHPQSRVTTQGLFQSESAPFVSNLGPRNPISERQLSGLLSEGGAPGKIMDSLTAGNEGAHRINLMVSSPGRNTNFMIDRAGPYGTHSVYGDFQPTLFRQSDWLSAVEVSPKSAKFPGELFFSVKPLDALKAR